MLLNFHLFFAFGRPFVSNVRVLLSVLPFQSRLFGLSEFPGYPLNTACQYVPAGFTTTASGISCARQFNVHRNVDLYEMRKFETEPFRNFPMARLLEIGAWAALKFLEILYMVGETEGISSIVAAHYADPDGTSLIDQAFLPSEVVSIVARYCSSPVRSLSVSSLVL